MDADRSQRGLAGIAGVGVALKVSGAAFRTSTAQISRYSLCVADLMADRGALGVILASNARADSLRGVADILTDEPLAIGGDDCAANSGFCAGPHLIAPNPERGHMLVGGIVGGAGYTARDEGCEGHYAAACCVSGW
jgi:hypothetical protein